jgi:hypothetical protein
MFGENNMAALILENKKGEIKRERRETKESMWRKQSQCLIEDLWRRPPVEPHCVRKQALFERLSMGRTQCPSVSAVFLTAT